MATITSGNIRQFAAFAMQEAMCASFAFGIFLSLGITKLVHIPGIPRYDLVFLLCLGIQWLMVRFRLESIDELKMICLFHILGLALEVYKVAHGSWAYPGAGYLKIDNVPLYSGFMYSSIGSYICQAFRRFDLKVYESPPLGTSLTLATLIYLNFFTNHFLPDARWLLTAAVFVIYFRTRVDFEVRSQRYRMPLSLSFLAMGFFIWIAENIVSRFQGYRYRYQQEGWAMVHGSKIGSWFLLVILSYVITEWSQARRRIKLSRDNPTDARLPVDQISR